MKKIVFMMAVSVDGYMEGPDRDISWHRVDQELLGHMNETLRPMSAFLSGRITWDLMAKVWPTADKDYADNAQMVEFAGIWKAMPKYVYSRTLKRADWNTTVCGEVDPSQVLALKAQAGGDMTVGGADLAAEFLRQDLIDEFRIYTHPAVVGKGKRMFGPMERKMDLKLVETRGFGNGVVLSRYQRV
jgi:dihydrofolate reductase